MNQSKIEKMKQMYPELMPAVTGNDELKFFLTRNHIKKDEDHIALIKNIEKNGFSFLREYQDVTGYYVAFFREAEGV